jgi:beta-glucosidase
LRNSGGLLPLDNRLVHSIAVIGSDAGTGARTQGEGSSVVYGRDTVPPYRAIERRAGHGVQVTYTTLDPGAEIPPQLLTPPSGIGHGLLVRYYADPTNSGRPVLSGVTRHLQLRRGAGSAVTHWSVTWIGTLTAPATGSYTFQLTSDHGGRFLINGRPVISATGYPATSTGRAHFVAGRRYPIEVEYHDSVGAARMSLDWLPPPDPYRADELAARNADVAIVFAGDVEGENFDRPDLSLPDDENTLISRVASANPNVIVVLNTGSAVTMPWINKVKGVIEAWYPGQEDGDAIAAVLFGDVDPSGKLPITFPKSDADTPAHTRQEWPGVGGVADYREGIDVGYRWYETRHIAPLFPFGYGLSYTTFAVHGLVAAKQPARNGVEAVSVDVANTGHRAGAEVVQLYVGMPVTTAEPPRQLKGFQKVSLAPGQTRQVHFTLTPTELAYWNTPAQRWVTATGTYRIMIGTSWRDIAGAATFRIPTPKRPVAAARRRQ